MTTNDLKVLKIYLSEEEIKQLVIDEYRTIIREEIKIIKPEKRMTNHDRIISNAVWYMLEEECDKILGVNTKEMIEEHVKRILNKGDFSSSIFRQKSAWDSEDSVGTKLLKECVIANKDMINDKVKSTIDEIDIPRIKDTLIECMIELLNEKFKS
jgi:hypothetical protein